MNKQISAAPKTLSFNFLKPYLFLLPIYILMIVFKYFPFAMAFGKSFFEWNGTNVNLFIGFANYKKAFADPSLRASVINCFWMAVSNVIIVLTIPLLAAELLFALKSAKGQYMIRTAFIFPMVVPIVVIILLWKWILAGDNGVFNTILTRIGLPQLTRPWLGSSKTALGAIIAIGFPWLGIAGLGGLQFLLYYGALQSIPKALFESAQIDGVNTWRRFFYIDVPMLASQIRLTVTLAIIGAVQVFDKVYILTKGGPGTATIMPSVVLYEQGFTYKKMGYSSAIGVLMFIVILALTVVNQAVMKKTEHMD
ncbi:sugar ABC transporter permease [Treponema sp. OMZ 840]|uniref:carbohydrate ABC transporter permease n=1 Tax=Treponema sp. OMZ 840 TaxID=244313 RepID=UPI003D8F3B34